MTVNRDQRTRLASLADLLIPAGSGMPAASEAGATEEWLDAVLSARPDLASGLERLLDRSAGRRPEEFLAELQTQDSEAFGVLVEAIAGAYFLNPQVRESIGYTGQTPQAIDPRVDYMEDGLLAAVICRGPIYRPTPGRSAQ